MFLVLTSMLSTIHRLCCVCVNYSVHRTRYVGMNVGGVSLLGGSRASSRRSWRLRETECSRFPEMKWGHERFASSLGEKRWLPLASARLPRGVANSRQHFACRGTKSATVTVNPDPARKGCVAMERAGCCCYSVSLVLQGVLGTYELLSCGMEWL